MAVISFLRLASFLHCEQKYCTSHEIIDTGGKLTLNLANSGSIDFAYEITLFEGVTFVRGVVVKFSTPVDHFLTRSRMATSNTWTRNLDPNFEKSEPCNIWTQKNLYLEKPGPCKTRTLKNLDSQKPGTRNTWTLKNLDPEKTRPFNVDVKIAGCREMIRWPHSFILLKAYSKV